MKPKVLDLYSGGGGCAQGYIEAGFEVTGVDYVPQADYPGEFIQADALEFLRTTDLSQYDVLRASPVCKGFSLAGYFHPEARILHENHIPLVREIFRATGKPYEIENVDRAPLIRSIMLCGTMFGLNVIRHRFFESNILLFQPDHPKHLRKAGKPGAIPSEGEYWCIGGHFGNKYGAALAMGIDWMHDRDAIAQAIPPAYTRWIAQFFLAYIASEQIA